MLKLYDTVYRGCHQNIPVIPFLEKHLGFVARMYEEDLHICRNMLRRAAWGVDESHVFFWGGYKDGSYCAAEQDVFIIDTTANRRCQDDAAYNAKDTYAFIIEVTGAAGKEVIGNVYELNPKAYADEVRRFSQPALRRQDIPPCSLPFSCHALPADPDYLEKVLDHQKWCRAKLAKAG